MGLTAHSISPHTHLIGCFKLNVAIPELLIPPTPPDLLLSQWVAQFSHLEVILLSFPGCPFPWLIPICSRNKSPRHVLHTLTSPQVPAEATSTFACILEITSLLHVLHLESVLPRAGVLSKKGTHSLSLPCLKLPDTLPPVISIKSNHISSLGCAYLSDFLSCHSLPPPGHSSHAGLLSVPSSSFCPECAPPWGVHGYFFLKSPPMRGSPSFPVHHSTVILFLFTISSWPLSLEGELHESRELTVFHSYIYWTESSIVLGATWVLNKYFLNEWLDTDMCNEIRYM